MQAWGDQVVALYQAGGPRDKCDFQELVGARCVEELPEWRPTPGLANRQLRCHLVDPVATLKEDEGTL